jgi:hypothetical protein
MFRTLIALAALLAAAAGHAQAQQAAADPARQIAELRRQVAALQSSVKALRTQLATEASARQAMQAAIERLTGVLTAMQADVRSLHANSILDLNGYLIFDHSSGYPTALFQGINVQVVNGTGNTQTANGLGNLIVGYNRPRTGAPVCSSGYYGNQADCLAKGGAWLQTHRSGSHNIVGGDRNSYSSWGGLVLGNENVVNAPFASVTGGAANAASADLSSVAGGSSNLTTGMYSTVGGGAGNSAAGAFSSVSGGSRRTASGPEDWVGGGASQDR